MLRKIVSAGFLITSVVVASPSARADAPTERPAALVEAPRSRGAALFSDELARLGGAVVTWLGERTDLSVDLLPATTLSSLEPPICAAPMSREDIIRSRVGRAARVRTTASCDDENRCKLRVRINRPPIGTGVWETHHDWEATVPGGAGRIDRFLEAMPRLSEPPPPPPGSMLATLGRSEGGLITVQEVAVAGRFRTTPTPASVTGAIGSALNGCFADGWSSARNEQAIVSFAPDGSAARCEAILAEANDHGDHDARARCLCDAFSHLRVSRGGAGRRLEIDFINHPSSAVLADGREHLARFDAQAMTGGFRGYPGFGDLRRPVAQCFAMAGVTSLTRASLRIVVDGTGALTRAEIGGAELTPEVSRCLQSVFRTLTFTCPVSGGEATWTGELVAYTRDP